MTFEPGSRLGPYEIVAPVGAGGMGEVYRARDTRLGRQVALKVLPAEFSSDARLRARLEREARAISALTHPNICTLYDLGRENGTDYLVMEYCEGETLAQRLKRGPLPRSEVAQIGAELASAIDRAHDQQLIHRDIKPDNIMLTGSGSRLLDFGLAKEETAAPDGDTLTAATGEGSLVGTLAYMAPEQLEGKNADTRSDIWGLGAVLYEMTTGRPPFEGASRAEIIAAVLSRDPALDRIADPALRHIVQKCLHKNADERWQSARDLTAQLRWIAESASGQQRRTIAIVGLGLLALVVIALATLAGSALLKRRGTAAPIARLSIALPAGTGFGNLSCQALSISPDGTRVVFSTRREGDDEVYWRQLDSFELNRVTHDGLNPTFSPDGEWIAFVRGTSLIKIPTAGGPEQILAELRSNPRGLSWASDGTIYYALGYDSGLARVSADGSGAAILTTPNESRGENSHRWPHILPGGRHLLFTIRTDQMASFDEATIAVLSIETGQWRTVLEGGSAPKYLASGHLVFGRGKSLLAVPFDLETLSVRGTPERIVEGVFDFPSAGAIQFDVASDAGTLAYVPADVGRMWESMFFIVDGRGVVKESFSIGRYVDSFRASPDGTQLAIQIASANDNIWGYDLQRRTLTRITFEPGDEVLPSWAPDGRSILFKGRKGLQRQAVDGSGIAEVIVPGRGVAGSCSPGCATIAFASAGAGSKIWIARKDDRWKVSLFVDSPFGAWSPEFSPDGRRIAYISRETGTPEVYLRALSETGRLQISSGGGSQPRWSADGRDLYYVNRDEFFRVRITPGSPITAGAPELLFRMSDVRSWDVIGENFILRKIPPPPFLASGIHVVPNWSREVKARFASR